MWAAVAEAYAFALIGGAAQLMRLRLPRPAVILGLLAVLYQGDLTLHTETSAFLSRFGALASIAWVVIFIGKLYLLAWALKLKLSRSAILVPAFGAIGLALIPHLLRMATTEAGNQLIAWWVFVLASAGLVDAAPREQPRPDRSCGAPGSTSTGRVLGGLGRARDGPCASSG